MLRLSSAQVTKIKEFMLWRINADAHHVPKYKIEDLVEDILKEVLPCINPIQNGSPSVRES